MNYQNNSETHMKALTGACENVCMFIKSIATDNASKDEQINSYKIKIDECQSQCSDLKTQLKKIREHVKTLGNLFHFTINKDDSTIDILTRFIASLSPNNNSGNAKKRKLFSYSPLKLSLKDKTEKNESMVSKDNCSKLEKENKISFQNKMKNVWKLQVKVDGKPSDLLKKSKQTTLNLQPQEDKINLDITTIKSPSSKSSILNSNTFNHDGSYFKTNDSDKITCIHDSPIDDSCNISISHFNKMIKPSKHMKMVKPSASHDQPEKQDQSSDETVYSPINIPMDVIQNEISPKKQIKNSNRNVLNLVKPSISHDQPEYDQSSDETVCSPTNIPMNVIQNEIFPKKQNKSSNRNVLNNCDIKLGLSNVNNDLPNYNFKEDPVRKRNERKLLNGWDCEDCRKFYEANNDNPVEAKKAMNHFSRHRSLRHQHHAPTPPGFWDPT